MNSHEKIPIIVVSSLLLFFVILIALETWLTVVYIIFFIAPFAIIWMVYSVIRFGNYKGRELDEDEEWGYADRNEPRSVVRKEL